MGDRERKFWVGLFMLGVGVLLAMIVQLIAQRWGK